MFVSDHIATMNTFITCAKIAEDLVKINFLLSSLKPDLCAGLFTSGLNSAGTYADFCDNLITQENNMAMLRTYQGHPSFNRQSQFTPHYNSSNGSSSKDLNAMDMDSADVHPKKLNPEEREKLRKSGSCFRCRQKGHMVNQCTAYPKNPTPVHTEKPSSSKIEEVVEDEEDTLMDACHVVIEDEDF
jgi:hypothetical protein